MLSRSLIVVVAGTLNQSTTFSLESLTIANDERCQRQ